MPINRINRINPTTAMGSASLKFYLICLLVACVIGWSAAVLTREEREALYRERPPVADERDADAELDNAFDLYTKRP